MQIDFSKKWIFTDSRGQQSTVDLPHDAMLAEKRYKECCSGVSGAFFSGGKYLYEKHFVVTSEEIGKKATVLFEGVYQNATVYCNGNKVAFHRNGFTEFCVDISDCIISGDNTIKVKVDNTLVPNCRYYTGSGIYRPVSLSINEKNGISNVKIDTLSYHPAVIRVSAEASVADKELQVEIFDDKRLVTKGGIGEIVVPNAILWSADTPKLYICKVSSANDSQSVFFGIRKIEWSGYNGLMLNGQRLKLKGGCIHHDNGILGACSYRDAEYRRIKILKEQGFNAVRIAHNPASRFLLDACDEIGMYVIDEAFDGWYIPKEYHDYSRDFWDNFESDLLSMIVKDINHPSVIAYSIGNEVTETASKKGVELCARMRNIIRSTDSTRPITCGINVLLNVYSKWGMGVYKDKDTYERKPLSDNSGIRMKKSGSTFFNALANKLRGLMFYVSKIKIAEKAVNEIDGSLDIVGLNYASSRYDIDAVKYPNRLMVGSETMVADLPYNWERVKKYSQLVGDFVWAAWDYLGEACIGDWTYYSYKGLPLLAGQGMIDITGKPLAAMRYMQVVWGDKKTPYICVRPLNHTGEVPTTSAWQFTNAIDSWSWQGYENKQATVEVFADCHKIRLLLNGKQVGERRIRDFKAIFSVKYREGVLEAIALDQKGNEICRSHLTSAAHETQILLKVDKKTLDIDELNYLEIEFTDKSGNIKPYIEQKVELVLNGDSVKLLGFGSALCKTNEIFNKTYHDSYRGRCLAVLQGVTLGETVIEVSSRGVASEKFVVEVR